MPTTHQASILLRTAGATACVLMLSGCSLFGANNEAKDEAAAPPPVAVASTAASSSPAAIEEPQVVAAKAMALFARPDVPERRWFTDLLPYLTDEYADEAQYTDPARVPFDDIGPAPTASQDAHNPQVVTVRFKTNDGPWQVVVVQDKAGAPWLIQAIEPDDPAPGYTP
ncbi:hypothetical protein [Arthrobacter sp.]|uniref:hypothetical protein n=1 Tax=Arthrobacter sp. TaxID=1667 RepID=UPI003A93EDD0